MPRIYAVVSAAKVGELLSRADRQCRDRGTRLSIGRRAVLELLFQENRPLTAAEIFDLSAARPSERPGQSRAIERALRFLWRQGLVARLAHRHAFVAIDPEDSRTAIFLTCEKCATSLRTDKVLLIPQHPGELNFRTRLVEVLGLCARCLRTERRQVADRGAGGAPDAAVSIARRPRTTRSRRISSATGRKA